MRWCFVFYVCSFHLSHSACVAIFWLARYGRFSIFRFCVSVRKYFAHIWTQQLSISMLQNCTEHGILVDKQLSFYSTFWSDPIFMPKLANTWRRRLHSGSIFADFRFGMKKGSYQKVVVIWLVELIKIHILTNFQGLRLINERETSKNLQKLTLVTTFAAIYLHVLAWKRGRIKKLQ